MKDNCQIERGAKRCFPWDLSELINTSSAVYEDIITRISCNLVGAKFSS